MYKNLLLLMNKKITAPQNCPIMRYITFSHQAMWLVKSNLKC